MTADKLLNGPPPLAKGPPPGTYPYSIAFHSKDRPLPPMLATANVIHPGMLPHGYLAARLKHPPRSQGCPGNQSKEKVAKPPLLTSFTPK